MNYIFLNQRKLNTVIFDFDGTLAKLNIDFSQMRKSVRELIYRYDIEPEGLRSSFALEMIDEVEIILKNNHIPQASSFRREAMRTLEDIEIAAAQKGELFEETKYMLSKLKNSFIRVGIITRNCRQAVYTVFRDIDLYCAAVICRDDVQHVKPHSEHLEKAMKKLGSLCDCTIMIGDHPLDIETGHKAGTLSAGVLTGRFQEDDFIRAGADAILPQAQDILQLLHS